LVEKRLRYPTGVRPLLLEEAARRRRIESRFVGILEDAAFAEVVPPIIDYADPYAALVGSAARQSYRFVDRDGELVAVRSDFTPMVARALAPVITPDDLPLRIFYRGDVVRCDATRLGMSRELFQIGAEIVGDGSLEAEIETLELVVRIAREFGIEPRVVYTDTAVAASLSEEERRAVMIKRSPSPGLQPPSPAAPGEGLPNVLLPAGEGGAKRRMRGVPLVEKLIAGTATLDDFGTDRLKQLAAILDPDIFILHLDDVDESPGYYTGLRFRLFGADSRLPIAQGGRYDDLYRRFGTPACAVGFTFTIDDLD
jgi:ATP phosphoribosyltransferase regulatory subunit HisZ